MGHAVEFNDSDVQSIKAKGLSLEQAYKQAQWIRDGSNFVILDRPCRVDDGIEVIERDEFGGYFTLFEEAMKKGRVKKFVPASGAASRMFSFLLKYLKFADKANVYEMTPNEKFTQKEIDEIREFFSNLKQFAFYMDLKTVIKKKGKDIDDLIDHSDFHSILEFLLTDKGMNFTDLPKGLIPFHNYDNGARTAFDEHLIEASVLCAREDGEIYIHFTVNQKYEDQIQNTFEEHSKNLKAQWSKYHIEYSYQKASTDTLALDMDNRPFHDAEGHLLFRPGGHGSLLENLNDLKGDIVFVKNIDNIVPDRLKKETFVYKRLIAGFLISLQEKMFAYLSKIEAETLTDDEFKALIVFCRHDLKLDLRQDIEQLSASQRNQYLFDQLNRPIRVCGMVKNVGEPGGGPFWIKGDEAVSKQIVEASQVNLESEEQKAILNQATHFNPVDLVCGLRDYNGASFNLHAFVDPSTRFVAQKTKDGKALKALEWPGLWNGAMARWITLFVEVPLSTFNPVKTVNDLLRDEHL